MNLRPEGGTPHLSMSMLPVAYWRHQSRDHPPWVEAIPQPGFSTIRTPPSPPLNKLKLSNSTRNILKWQPHEQQRHMLARSRSSNDITPSRGDHGRPHTAPTFGTPSTHARPPT